MDSFLFNIFFVSLQPKRKCYRLHEKFHRISSRLRPLYWFSASSTHLFAFVMNYQYDKKQSREDKLVYFCQIASQYVDKLNFTGNYAEADGVEYPVIFPR